MNDEGKVKRFLFIAHHSSFIVHHSSFIVGRPYFFKRELPEHAVFL